MDTYQLTPDEFLGDQGNDLSGPIGQYGQIPGQGSAGDPRFSQPPPQPDAPPQQAQQGPPMKFDRPMTFNLDGPQQQQPAGGGAQAGDKKKIDITPEGFKADYDHGALEKAKTPGEVFEAMKPKSKNEYMDWWEKQHGAIVQKWDAVQQELGQRPDTHAPASRQDKFSALLDFGLRLMQQSSQMTRGPNGIPMYANTPSGSLSSALGGTIQDYFAGREKEGTDWDAKQAAVQQGRAAELKTIGTGGDALVKQGTLDKNQTGELRDTAAAAKSLTPEYPKNQTRADKTGQMWQQGVDGTWSKIPGLVTDPNTGPRGGRGGSKQSVYSEKLAEYDQRNPLQPGATPQQKQEHDLAALAYASGQTRPDATLASTARSQAARELGSEQNYYPSDHDGMPYEDAIRERTAEIYATYSGKNVGGITSPTPKRVYDPVTKKFR